MVRVKLVSAMALDSHVEILDAVGRAKAFRLCLRRIWAIASSLPGGAERLSTLIPAPDTFSIPSHNLRHHEHEHCTFDFCEHSRVDFTSVRQRHEENRGKTQCKGNCEPRDFVLSARTWREKAAIWKLDGQSLLDASDPYMAISHVWADGTGAGIWGSGKVNECLWEFFCGIARDFQCEGCWWDTISIPSDDEGRIEALNNMHNNYADARITLVHDLYLREWEWIDAETACFAIVMSPWYSRGWTALELAKSHKVKILFKAKNNRHVIKDLDVDILAKVQGNSRHHDLAQSISKLRNTNIRSLGDLLAALGPRDTSRPRDLPIISGLLAGVDVSGGLSQQEIYQRILRKLGRVAQGHLFHNSAPMSSPGFSWCPSNILDMPLVGSAAESLEIRENGDVEGIWKVYPTDSVKPGDFIWKDTHPLNQVFLKSALSGNSVEKHILLLEVEDEDNHVAMVKDRGSTTRALLVRFVMNEESTACCHYVGPVYFISNLFRNTYNDPPKLRVRIDSTEGLQEIAGRAWDHLVQMGAATESVNGRSPIENAEAMALKTLNATSEDQDGQSLADTGFKDWKAIFYSDKDASKSLFSKECSLQIPKDFGSEAMIRYFKSDRDSDNVTAPSQAFIYGHKGIVEKVKGSIDNDHSYDAGKLMLLGLDENDKITVNLDDDSARRSLAGTALLLATHLATDKEIGSKAEHLVTLLLSHDAPHDIDSTGQCPLHLALQSQDCRPGLIEKLLTDEKNPADPNTTNAKGNTTIHLAAKRTQLDQSIVKLLVEKTTRNVFDATDNAKQQAALHIAAKKGNLLLAELLIDRGAATNITDSYGRRPLYYAAAGNHHHVVRTLLECQENPDNSNDDGNGIIKKDKGLKNENKTGQNLHDAQAEAKESSGKSVREQDKMTALWLASQKGYALVVDILIEHNADIHSVDKDGRTPLMLAAEGGHGPVVDKLLNRRNPKDFQKDELNKALLLAAKGKHGETITILHRGGAKSGLQDADGMTALHWTIEARDETRANLLVQPLESQSEINVLDHKKRSALILAADKGLNEVVRVLLERKAEAKLRDSYQRTVLHWAVMRGNSGIMEQLLDHEDIKDFINEADNMGRTALHWAAYRRHWRKKGAMARILDSHPQYDTKDNDHSTPLILAAETGNLEAVEQLLHRKVHPMTTNKEGLTALDQAAINGHGDVVAELLSYVQEDKAKMDALKRAVDHNQLSVAIKIQKSIISHALRSSATTLILFLISATSKYPAAVENFVKSIRDPNGQDKNGQTALMLSVKNRNQSLTTALLSLSTKKDLKDIQGKTALMIALISDNQFALDKLLEAGADPDIQDDQGYTALHHAVERGLLSIADMLLSKNADLSLVDQYKRTALHIAMERHGWTDTRVKHYSHFRFWFAKNLGRRGYSYRRGDIDRSLSLPDQMCRLLLQSGARLDAEDAQGQTPLHWAAQNHPSAVYRILEDREMSSRTLRLNSQNKKKQTPLFLAAEVGHASTVDKLLAERADPNLHDIHGCTPLTQAARNGHKEVVDVLLNTDKLDLNARDATGRTALLLAAENGHLDVVKSLLDHEANSDLVDFDGGKAWQKAMDKGYAAIVDSLLSRPSPYIEDKRHINEALILASRRGWTPLAKVLLDKGADTSFQNGERCTALHMASMNGHREMVEMLLEKPRIFPIEDDKGRTALSQATEHGFASIVGLLLGRKDVKDDIHGWKVPGALLLAAEKGYTKIVELIIESTKHDGDFGLDVNIRDSAGRTAVALAAANGNGAIVELLLLNDADASIRDDHAKTALHHAAWGGYDDVVGILLEHNVDLRDALDKRRQSALHLASERASEKAIEQLLKKRANVNAAAEDGQTALHRAAWSGSGTAVELLCSSGADSLIRDSAKNKPWQVAAEKGHESVAKKLVRSEGNLRDEHITRKQGLIFAAEMGYAGIGRSLLERKAEADTKDENGLTPLHWAMKRGDQAFVELLLEEKWMTTIDALDQIGQTPLCHGVLAGQAAVVKLLLRGTADPNKFDKDGKTPLHYAASQCNWEMVRILVDHNADVHARDGERQKAWQLAAQQGGHQVVWLLLGKEPDVRSLGPQLEELFLQVVKHKQDRVSMVHLLLQKGVNKDARDQYGSSAVGLAAESENHEVLALLLSKNADPGIPGWRGKTAILWAAAAGNTKIVSLLLDNTGGLKDKIVNHRDGKGQTALLKALEQEQDNVVKLLLDKGSPEINVNIQGKHQKAALHLAVKGGNPGLVKLLLKKAEQGLRDEWGRTALLVAAEKEKKAVFEILLDSLTDSELVDSSDNQGRTALLVAAEEGNSDMIEKLLQKGADKDHADVLGRTALLIATQNGNRDVVDLLLKRGADHTKEDSQTRTPLHLAVANGDKALVEMFLGCSGKGKHQAIHTDTPLRPSLFRLAVRSGNNEVLRLIAEQMLEYE